MMKKTTILLVMVLAVAFLGFAVLSFGLPKAQKSTTSTAAPVQKTTVTPQKARFAPVILDDEQVRAGSNGLTYPVGRYLGPSQLNSAAVPYINIRHGIPETPGGNNHMRPQVAIGPAGQIHMVYGVFHSDSGTGVVSSPADSNRNGLYFYNAYNCDGGDSLRFGNSDPSRFGTQMTFVFGGIGDNRPRDMQLGGIFIPPGTSAPVVYGNRLVQRTDLGNGFFSRKGWAVMKDGASCLGLFTMDTSVTTSTYQHPVMFPLNESTWVATLRDGNLPEGVGFTYTIDRGLTWSAVSILPTNSPWFNACKITGANNVFYIVSVADPNDPTAFQTTERPVYLKGTYNPGTGAITFGSETDIIGNFEQPGFLTSFIDVGVTMIGDTLHVAFNDWNNWLGNGFPGAGGHIHHASVDPIGNIKINKVTDINIDGRLPDRSYTLFGFAVDVWVMNNLVYDAGTGVLYDLWSAPPDNGSFGWADFEQFHVLACYDIFMSASPNNGRSWDAPQNVTQTDHPGCDGVTTPCEHEDFFTAADRVANDTVWVVALVQNYPGIQESAIASGISPDPGPLTNTYDNFRLYKVPARSVVASVRGDLNVPSGDTLQLYQIAVRPRGGVFTDTLQVSNIGLLSFFVDSVTLGAGLNDGFLITTDNAVGGSFVPVAGGYKFNFSLNTNGVGPTNVGLRTGQVKAYIHSTSPPQSAVLSINLSVYVVPSLCFNRKVTIHSGNNFTDVGSQGSIKDQGGLGMNYNIDQSDRFYDGGVAIANSALNGGNCASGPRKLTRQLFSDKFLRCTAPGVLDSTAGSGYYNLHLTSVGTDVRDSILVWKNVWEQSTHADSSDFLLQTVKVINISNSPIDSVAMGVLYDVDVTGQSNASEDVSGDTVISYGGNTFHLGYVATNDIAIDTCAVGVDMYGSVIIPDSIGTLTGQFIHPRGEIMYDQVGFSYNIDCGNPNGGDTLAQRYFWNLNLLTSTIRRSSDSLTGIWEDTSGLTPGHFFICGGPSAGATGRPYRNDEGYLAVAKKVYGFPVNGGGVGLVARYGLDGLAASIDSTFNGPGQTYTVIHVASVSGLADLIAHAQKGIDWYAKHAKVSVGPRQTRLKGDLNNTGDLSPADVVAELNNVFLGIDVTGGLAIPVCVADLNDSGDLSPADVVLLLNGTFLGSGCPNCLRPCVP